MFKRIFRLVGFVLALVPATAAALPHAKDQVTTVRVTGKSAEIRIQPTTRSALIGRAVRGSLLQVVSKEGDWYRIVVTPQVRLIPLAPASGFVEVGQVEPLPPNDPRAFPKPGAVPAQAAGRGAKAAPARGISPRLFGQVAYQQFDANRSFDAIFGSASAPIYGGGIDVLIGRSLFVQADVTHTRRTGERAFVFNDDVFRLGIEQELQLTPVALSVGYRFSKNPRLVPYLGAGATVLFYRERSPGSGAESRFSENAIGYQGIGGFEFRLSRLISAALEGRYSYIPGILGDNGVSKEFNEKNVGGISGGVKVIIGR